MSIPSFNAEASLYESSRRYATNSLSGLGAGGFNLVQPSMSIYVDGRYICDGQVTDNGYIQCNPIGGGGDPGCRPGCGPCRNHVKTCILRNCDDVQRAC